MYLKISITSNNSLNSPINFSSNLGEDEKITNIEVIDKNRLLIIILGKQGLKGAVYDLKNNQIISYINR